MLQKNYGFRINVKDKFDMFCEYQAGYIFTIREINYPMLKNAFEEKKLNYQNLGKVTTESIEINSKKLSISPISAFRPVKQLPDLPVAKIIHTGHQQSAHTDQDHAAEVVRE